jgi:endonuclease III
MGTTNIYFLYERGNGKIYNNKIECEKENSKECFPIRGHLRGYPKQEMAEKARIWFASPAYQLEHATKKDIIREEKRRRSKDTQNNRNKEEKDEVLQQKKQRRSINIKFEKIDKDIKALTSIYHKDKNIDDNPEKYEQLLKQSISAITNRSDYWLYKEKNNQKEEKELINKCAKQYFTCDEWERINNDNNTFWPNAFKAKYEKEIALKTRRRELHIKRKSKGERYKTPKEIEEHERRTKCIRKQRIEDKGFNSGEVDCNYESKVINNPLPSGEEVNKRVHNLLRMRKVVNEVSCEIGIYPDRELWYSDFRDIWQLSCGCILCLYSQDKMMMQAQLILRKFGYLNYSYLSTATPEDLLRMQSLLTYATGYNHFNDAPVTLIAWAKAIKNRYHGVIPNNYKELIRFHGISIKGASVIMNDIFGTNYLPVIDSVLKRIIPTIGWTKETDPILISYCLRRWVPVIHMTNINTVFGNINQIANGIQSLGKKHPKQQQYYKMLGQAVESCGYPRSVFLIPPEKSTSSTSTTMKRKAIKNETQSV